MKTAAFAPGHISGFFEPIYQNHNVERSGSRGAGINISLGATSYVTVQNSLCQTIDIHINNKKVHAPVSKLAIKYLIGNTPLHVSVNTKLDLPIGQGFGMSGAGALSCTLALSKILQKSRDVAVKSSHYAEVTLHTGLGDVLASSFGGIEIRRAAGLPPWGMIEHIPGKYDVVLCIIGKKIDTKKILTDSTKLSEIASHGRHCTKKLVEKPSLENLFMLSNIFTKRINIANDKIQKAIETVNTYGMSSMCMLGNSVFAIGNTPMLSKILSNFGIVYVCSVDMYGARIFKEKKKL
jgi:pantoate kinase